MKIIADSLAQWRPDAQAPTVPQQQQA
jgi:hypothetical protein